MLETTAHNLRLLETLRKDEDGIEQVSMMSQALEQAASHRKRAQL
jgi:hypothetical protein